MKKNHALHLLSLFVLTLARGKKSPDRCYAWPDAIAPLKRKEVL
ncbi:MULTISPECIES: hypothetical protein [unclassified Bacillus (in: firmicutes)]|nr:MULTISPECIES: hypothetical protein [unclassified Bacillus (in: firmicutes)]